MTQHLLMWRLVVKACTLNAFIPPLASGRSKTYINPPWGVDGGCGTRPFLSWPDIVLAVLFIHIQIDVGAFNKPMFENGV